MEDFNVEINALGEICMEQTLNSWGKILTELTPDPNLKEKFARKNHQFNLWHSHLSQKS